MFEDLPPNRSMPSSVVIPVLAYPDVRAAVAWLERVFGCVERLQIGDHRSQVLFGEAAFVVCQGTGSSTVMVRVRDADAHHARVVAAGVTGVPKPTAFPYGEKQYSVKDVGGHTWTFSESVTDMNPADWGGTLVR